MLTLCRWLLLATIWAQLTQFSGLHLPLRRVDQNFKIKEWEFHLLNYNSNLLWTPFSSNFHRQCLLLPVQVDLILQALTAIQAMVSISRLTLWWPTQDLVWWIRGLTTKETTPKVAITKETTHKEQPKASLDPHHEEATTLCLFIKPLSLTLTRCRTRDQQSFTGHYKHKT